MNRLVAAAVVAIAALSASACAYNETLGRNQLLIVDDAALTQQSDAAWAQALRSQPLSRDVAANARIRRVGERIVQAAGLTDRSWEYALFVSESPNAFVLPSGKIGVTTGLLALVRNDDQLATVLGHEVGHVVARHAAERYSTTALTSVALSGVQSAAGDYSRAAGAVGGLGAQLGVLLPFSRNHELEADRIGVDYLQRAGYKPSEAIALWRLMAQQRRTSNPEFASTHPSDATRISALEQSIASRGWA
ncbi:MAG: M48 family metallopeptidase [bacterium]|nr:M48 family metallopeptidase [bacterium]